MSTYRQLTFLVLDELKITSDDALFNEEHIMFLLDKYRGFILKKEYKDIKKDIPESNYQTICLELIETPAIPGDYCEGIYLRSKEKIPNLMSITSPRVFNEDYFNGEITLVSKERMKYVGNNKWLKNIIYAAIGPDNYLYLKSVNPQFLYLDKTKLTGIFENPSEASQLSCDKGDVCDPLDFNFPLEEALIPTMIELVVKELTGSIYKPEDTINNASDDLSTMASFLRNNMKSNFQKKIDGD